MRRDVRKLVDQGVAAVIKTANDRIYTEVLHHLHTCQTFASDFEGRAEVALLSIAICLFSLKVG